MDLAGKRESEKKMVAEMIGLYCRKQHGSRKGTLSLFDRIKSAVENPSGTPCGLGQERLGSTDVDPNLCLFDRIKSAVENPSGTPCGLGQERFGSTDVDPNLCPQCRELLSYAEQRIDKCPLMEEKTFCSSCRVHCYAPEKREQIRAVMRFSGPRMLFHRPLPALRHAWDTVRAKRRRERQSP